MFLSVLSLRVRWMQGKREMESGTYMAALNMFRYIWIVLHMSPCSLTVRRIGRANHQVAGRQCLCRLWIKVLRPGSSRRLSPVRIVVVVDGVLHNRYKHHQNL